MCGTARKVKHFPCPLNICTGDTLCIVCKVKWGRYITPEKHKEVHAMVITAGGEK
jgi:hypothetical protein